MSIICAITFFMVVSSFWRADGGGGGVSQQEGNPVNPQAVKRNPLYYTVYCTLQLCNTTLLLINSSVA
jgi:hypothetical protein